MVNRHSLKRWRFDAIRHDGHGALIHGSCATYFRGTTPISFPFAPSKKVLKCDAAQRAKLQFLFAARVYQCEPPKHKVVLSFKP